MLGKQFQLRKINFSIKHAVSRFLISFLVSFLIAYVPSYEALSSEACSMLFILSFSAFLWITGAIPSFAVSFLIIALEILLLGYPDLNFDSNSKEWLYYLKPWSSPLIFLFLAGFILAIAASKTKLDLWLAKKVLLFFGNSPNSVLTGLMLTTFVLSMFISNTATAAMMMTMLVPILKNMKENNPFQKGIILAIVVAANLGGMGTIIGTPPNAIAVGILGDNAPSFLEWMVMALPPGILILLILRWVILKKYASTEKIINIDKIKKISHYDDSTTDFSKIPTIPSWKKSLVILVFIITILLWLTGPLHLVPTTVVALFPIVIFTIFGIITSDDIKEIRWDVIILIIGGLALGSGVVKTGLDEWLGLQINLQNLNLFLIVCLFSMIVIWVSNFMSNTAATNIMLPLIVALVSSMGESIVSYVVISVALCASCAMILPVSTPPNAIAFSTGKLNSKDFIFIGLVAAIVGPVFILSLLSFYT
ncbi:SLC13 family permease [Malaciobacter marinus]|jgi:sodium-dependent dicarboxylate transporter 2/3/5|uniref:Dihydroorotate dehydrogenase n=1 Tax=Malaciobacter marinus TaxID=505249 RepID=A0A1T5AI98_9BACT|nr:MULTISPECIES: DASS family sodium-coupled anion symporter [Malaciobacter]AXX88455.1 sodium:dicarboxylate cotransporter (permease SLC13 domain) [Malaciobacter marinus]PHO13468.1 dihydroorotate dehydrogenase [Malaciobacter marinus]PHO14370.1 dihydroorotate dehydrogenase [Malaciobacter marinus]RYA24687.1 dihydroorotate dehydrogenase [Malaciobacter halophilus]SKB34585.1 solute carrier family 13 (sodium-dependent dicarboxylate transporter), member 2/3/5 [Malaciobacter marinus]